MRSFRKDDRVSHTRFGPGVVVECDARYTLIAFDEEGVRKFLTTLVQLERSELPLPVKRAPARRRGRPVAKRDQPDRTRRKPTSASHKRHDQCDETHERDENQQRADPVSLGGSQG